MSPVPPVPLAVLGSPELFITTLVAALRAHGFVAERMRSPDRGRGVLPEGGPGVLIVDIDPPDAGGVITRAAGAGWIVLALGAEADRERAAAAIVAGADGWIPKSASFAMLLQEVQAAAAGGLQMSAEERSAWLEVHRSAKDAVLAQVQRLEQLSPREREVLRHLAEGKRAAEVCGLLFVSISTVRTHIRSILVKLGVNSQEQATAIYRETSRRLTRTLGRRPRRE